MIVPAEVKPAISSIDTVPEGIPFFRVKGKAVPVPHFECRLMTVYKDMRLPIVSKFPIKPVLIDLVRVTAILIKAHDKSILAGKTIGKTFFFFRSCTNVTSSGINSDHSLKGCAGEQ